jgi:hypothetical protein
MAPTYARLTGDLWLDPGLAGVPDEAFRVYVSSISYAAQQLTDGFVPRHVAVMLTSNLDEPLAAEPWRPLIEGGLWLEVEGGFQIKGYLKHNKSKAEIEAARSKVAERVTKHRETKASRVTPEPVTRYIGVSNPPIEEELDTEQENKINPVGHADARPTEVAAFDTFWSAYPLKRDKAKAQKAWRQAIKKADAEAIIAAAVAYRDDPNREDKYTKYPASWLNAEAWNDGPLPDRGRPTPPPDRLAAIRASIAALTDEDIA